MKLIHIKRRTLIACLLCAALFFGIVSIPNVITASATTRQLPIYCVDRGEQKLCSISFDAAWGNEDTQTLIDILDRYQVKATFFVVGQWAEKYPESVKALHDAGHEVMNHSSTHPHFPQLSADKVICELNGCNDKVEAVTGVRPTLVRFPYGDYDDASINAARSIGMEPIQWDVEHLETEEPPCSARGFLFFVIPLYSVFSNFKAENRIGGQVTSIKQTGRRDSCLKNFGAARLNGVRFVFQ